MLLIVSMIWGAAPAIIKFTLADFPPLIFLTYRFFISSVIAVLWISGTGQRLPTKPSQWRDIFWYSTIGVTLTLGLLFFGFDKTTSLTGNILGALGPLVVVAAGALFLGEHVTGTEKVGITTALAGTLFIVLAPFFNGGYSDILGALEGNLLIILAIITDAAAAILAKVTIRNRVPAALLAHLSFVIGFVSLVPFAIAIHGGTILSTIARAPIGAHMGVWFMAVVSGTIAYSLRNRAVQTIEVSETAPFTYLYPLWGAPLSVLWLGEKITAPYILGAAIIAVGVVIAEYKRKNKEGKI